MLGSRSTETSIFLLLIGALVWAAGHFAPVAVFRHHQPLPAIVLSGAILLLNVSLTVREQYLHLLIFAAAALVLAMRLNLREQAHEWRVRGMRDVADISDSFMRSGGDLVARGHGRLDPARRQRQLGAAVARLEQLGRQPARVSATRSIAGWVE